MHARFFLLLSGAAGLGLAALLYFLAALAPGVLSFLILIPAAGIVILVLLVFVSLIEIVVMTTALVRLAPHLPNPLLYVFAMGYVAFAGVYAQLYALLVPDVRGIQILAALCLVRWLTLLLVHPAAQTK
ncbi:MAG: hypothetical protein HY741_19700 [Chloroflexi bacterium]|nr:hypothetical protein [Chloroflexota bacterium]